MSDLINANNTMASMLIGPSQQRHKPGTYTQQQWEAVRPVIERLYKEKELKDVMRIMSEQHGHHATMKMYKSRITQWGLDKKHKHADMFFILHKRTRRSAVGKDTRWAVRGRELNYEEVIRFFNRKGGAPKSSELLQTTPPPTPSHITYSTPSPQPSSIVDSALSVTISDGICEDQAQLTHNRMSDTSSEVIPTNDQEPCVAAQTYESSDDHAFYCISANYLQHFITSTSPVPRSLSPSQIHYVPELLFKSIQEYIESSTGNGRWRFSDNFGGSYIDVNSINISTPDLASFRGHCNMASGALRDGFFAAPFKSLSHACRLLRKIFDEQPLLTLSTIFRVCLNLIFDGFYTFSTILINLLSSLALNSSDKHSTQDPWARIWKLLASIPPGQCGEAILKSCECFSTTFSQRLGGFHPLAIFCYSDYLDMVDIIKGPAASERRLRSLLLEVQCVFGPNHQYALFITEKLCFNLLDQKQDTECYEMAEVMCRQATLAGYISGVSHALMIKGLILEELGCEQLIEDHLEEAVETATLRYGLAHPSVASALYVLEQFYRIGGGTLEADELREHILELIPEVDDFDIALDQE